MKSQYSANKPLRKISGSRWQKLRERIFSRDCGLCQECLRQGYIKAGSEVDHIIPVLNGGTDDESNLQILCEDHHRIKTAYDLGNKYRPTIGLDGWPIE